MSTSPASVDEAFARLPKHFTVVTHSGGFHADEVFALAVLELVCEVHGKTFHVIRTRDESVIQSADMVFDVGRLYDPASLRFDHHGTEGAGKRDNGIPYATFGLVWNTFGKILCGNDKEIVDMIDIRLVQGIDGPDNGVLVFQSLYKDVPYYGLSSLMGSMQPTWQEDQEMIPRAFEDMRLLAKRIIIREIAHAQSVKVAEHAVRECIAKRATPEILIIDKKYPWGGIIEEFPEISFVIYPEPTGNRWRAAAVRTSAQNFALKKAFPKVWGGLEGEVLRTICGVSDAVFVHNGGFLAVAESKEGAEKLAQKALLA
jgi:uncharacterized UPF0160 family protein